MPLRPAFRAARTPLGAHDETDCMNERRAFRQFPYRRSPDQDRRDAHRPVVVVGAGPVGLCAAIDLAQRGVPVVLLDDADRIGEGSRGICYAKRTLEILDRLGVAGKCLAKGVTWKVGKVFQRDALLYRFDLLPEDGHKMPAFINLQQYYLEQFLCERAAELGAIDIRWRNKVSGIEPRNDGASAHDRHAGRPLSARRRLGDRRRRRALDAAPAARPRVPGSRRSRTAS